MVDSASRAIQSSIIGCRLRVGVFRASTIFDFAVVHTTSWRQSVRSAPISWHGSARRLAAWKTPRARAEDLYFVPAGTIFSTGPSSEHTYISPEPSTPNEETEPGLFTRYSRRSVTWPFS